MNLLTHLATARRQTKLLLKFVVVPYCSRPVQEELDHCGGGHICACEFSLRSHPHSCSSCRSYF